MDLHPPSPAEPSGSCKRKREEDEESAPDGESQPKAPIVENDVVALDEQQEAAVQLALQGRSIFLTGGAGTGKSVVLREMVARLKEQRRGPLGRRLVVAVTALSGVAADNIGGQTIHSFAGIGKGLDPAGVLLAKVREDGIAAANRVGYVDRWNYVDVLVIDEVSMMSSDLFGKLDHIGRTIRNCKRPFGGIQLILCGDFFQLAPVEGREAQEAGIKIAYAFESELWKKSIDESFHLTRVHRQSDEQFVAALGDIRVGKTGTPDVVWLRNQFQVKPFIEGAVHLYGRNVDVNNHNTRELLKLRAQGSSGRTFKSVVRGRSTRDFQDGVPPKEITLAVGAPVMLLRNMPEYQLVNGSRGVVIGFEHSTSFKYEVVGPKHMMKCCGFDADELSYLCPVVRFPPISGSKKPREYLLKRAIYTLERHDGFVEMTRAQFPLKLAWALTIHKSQGLTFDEVNIDLKGVNFDGLVYVALSRVRSPAGLRVRNFQQVKTNAKVKKFYQGL